MPEQFTDNFDRLADGLAATGYAIADQFLSEAEVTGILSLDEFQSGLLHFRKSGVGPQGGKTIHESIRGDYIRWIDRETAPAPLAVYLDRIQSLVTFLNRSLFLSLKDIEVHMTVYPPGAFYRRHLDQFRSDDRRKLSFICYLNHHWTDGDGGQLRMHLPQGHCDILPEAGKLVCFRSDQIEHEVLPATRERLSLTGWMLDREFL